jgi:hypothetical protein
MGMGQNRTPPPSLTPLPADAQFRALIDGMSRRIAELRRYIELLNTDVQSSLSRLEADLELLKQLAPVAGRGPVLKLRGVVNPSPIPVAFSPVDTAPREEATKSPTPQDREQPKDDLSSLLSDYLKK